jgi:hypothetical protein
MPDSAGESDPAITVDSNNVGTRDLLILDPLTGRPLAAETIFQRVGPKRHVTAPWTDTSVLYLAGGIRAAIDESAIPLPRSAHRPGA